MPIAFPISQKKTAINKILALHHCDKNRDFYIQQIQQLDPTRSSCLTIKTLDSDRFQVGTLIVTDTKLTMWVLATTEHFTITCQECWVIDTQWHLLHRSTDRPSGQPKVIAPFPHKCLIFLTHSLLLSRRHVSISI